MANSRRKRFRCLWIGACIVAMLSAVPSSAWAQMPLRGDANRSESDSVTTRGRVGSEDASRRDGSNESRDRGTESPSADNGASAFPVEPDRDRVPPLQIDGFLFVDEAGNRVVRPQTTWEEFERVIGAISEKDAPRFQYSLDRLSVTGQILADRAEFQFEWKVLVEATGKEYVDVPIGLSRWHLTRSPEVKGCRDFALFVDADAGGHVARMSVAKESLVTIRMAMVTSVLPRPDPSMSLQLPDLPVVIDVDQSELVRHLSGAIGSRENAASLPSSDSAGGSENGAEVEVLGRGGEIVDSSSRRLRVRCSGGPLTLRWASDRVGVQSLPLLEVDSDAVVRWSDPNTPAIAAVEMTVRNLRGVVSQLDLQLPPGAVLLDIPRLGDPSAGRQLD